MGTTMNYIVGELVEENISVKCLKYELGEIANYKEKEKKKLL